MNELCTNNMIVVDDGNNNDKEGDGGGRQCVTVGNEEENGLINVFDMVVKEFTFFDQQVEKANARIQSIILDQKEQLRAGEDTRKALLAHVSSSTRGLIPKELNGLGFTIEKAFDGEATFVFVASLYVHDDSANARLLDAIIRETATMHMRRTRQKTSSESSAASTVPFFSAERWPFGQFTVRMRTCFTEKHLNAFHAAFIELCSGSMSCDTAESLLPQFTLLGKDITCEAMGMTEHETSHVMLGDEIAMRFMDLYRSTTMHDTMMYKDRYCFGATSKREFYAFNTDNSWKSAWFVPQNVWVTRDIYCALKVAMFADEPMTALEVGSYISTLATKVMLVPANSIFRVRIFSVSTPVSTCLDFGEVAMIQSEKQTVQRLAGLIGVAMTVMANAHHIRDNALAFSVAEAAVLVQNRNLNEEFFRMADGWYRMQIFLKSDVDNDIEYLDQQADSHQMFADERIDNLVRTYLQQKFRFLDSLGAGSC